MHTCPECGNHDMHAREVAGATVHECGLCGATFGDRRTLRDVELADEAAMRGVDPAIWPLASVVERLPGFSLGRAAPGDAAASTLPSVELVVTGRAALLQVENLAKALRLAGGALRCAWRLEARYEQTLVFVLGVGGAGDTLRDARLDVEALAGLLDRDMRLGWWRHDVNEVENG